MPVIQSAKKRMRQEKKRTAINRIKKENLKILIKNVRADNGASSTKSAQNLNAVFSALDKAAKVGLIHKNKSARLKSRLSKAVSQPSSTSGSKATRLKSSKKKVMTHPSSGGRKTNKKA